MSLARVSLLTGGAAGVGLALAGPALSRVEGQLADQPPRPRWVGPSAPAAGRRPTRAARFPPGLAYQVMPYAGQTKLRDARSHSGPPFEDSLLSWKVIDKHRALGGGPMATSCTSGALRARATLSEPAACAVPPRRTQPIRDGTAT